MTFFLTACFSTFAQSVGINNNGGSPDASAILDVASTTKGLLAPSMTAAQRSAIGTPATGLLVFQIDGTSGYYYINGTPATPAWTPVSVPNGTSTGDMLYWNGTAWVGIAAGIPGQFLQFASSNIPAWQGISYPTVTTNSVTNNVGTTATCGGNVTTDGGANVTARGVCWATSQNPTTANAKTSDGTGTGTFTSSLTGLSPATQYYVRAYATNSAGTAYGNQTSFTTPKGQEVLGQSTGIEIFALNTYFWTGYQAVHTGTISSVELNVSGSGTFTLRIMDASRNTLRSGNAVSVAGTSGVQTVTFDSVTINAGEYIGLHYSGYLNSLVTPSNTYQSPTLPPSVYDGLHQVSIKATIVY